MSSEAVGTLSKELLEFFCSETGITSDTAHGKCIDWVIAWNSNNANPVGHHDVLALANDAKIGFLKGLDRIEMVDAGDFRHD